jgi:hypothetical protein
MDPTAASKYDVIESAVFISADKRGARPGAWADDEYTGIDFMTVMMTAADQHAEANAQRDEAENPDFKGANAANSPPSLTSSTLVSSPSSSKQSSEVPPTLRLRMQMTTTELLRTAPLLLACTRATATMRQMRWQRRTATRKPRHLTVLGPGISMTRWTTPPYFIE